MEIGRGGEFSALACQAIVNLQFKLTSEAPPVVSRVRRSFAQVLVLVMRLIRCLVCVLASKGPIQKLARCLEGSSF